MRLECDHVVVQVPATSANLGPGYDSFGIALGLWDQVEVRATTSKTEVEVTGEGAGTVPTDDDHLVVRALRAALDVAGASQVGLQMRCTNRIPHGRGLGSSASAACAGILAARGLIAEPEALGVGETLDLLTDMEGHPDNAAPTVLGGATVAWMDGTHARARQLPVDERIGVLVAVPDFELATAKARAILPDLVPRADAIFNASRTALLVRALAGETDLLWSGTEDRLHQRQRAEVMPQTTALLDRLRAAGWPAVISGAGPSLLVFETDQQLPEQAAEGWTWLRPGIATSGGWVRRV